MNTYLHLRTEAAPVAVLYQALPPPTVDGVHKPPKVGGYSDSSADIAYGLQQRGVPVLTPHPSPSHKGHLEWCFPDTEAGIKEVIERGVKCLWLNTVLFAGHPVWELASKASLQVIGQKGETWDRFDDKHFTNSLFMHHSLPVPHSVKVRIEGGGVLALPDDLSCPVIVKPVRGRGSFGVTLCKDLSSLDNAFKELKGTGNEVIVEEYLSGDEITVTVMPPGRYTIDGRERIISTFWSLPPVKRVGHSDGVLPYSGKIPVVQNSRVITEPDPSLAVIREACEKASALVAAKAPVRIDCRRDGRGVYKLFDFNLKPNITGQGRRGREEADSLVALSARAIEWDYSDLLLNIWANSWAV